MPPLYPTKPRSWTSRNYSTPAPKCQTCRHSQLLRNFARESTIFKYVLIPWNAFVLSFVFKLFCSSAPVIIDLRLKEAPAAGPAVPQVNQGGRHVLRLEVLSDMLESPNETVGVSIWIGGKPTGRWRFDDKSLHRPVALISGPTSSWMRWRQQSPTVCSVPGKIDRRMNGPF